VGEEVELIIMPQIDPSSLPEEAVPNLSASEVLKSVIGGVDKETEKKFEKAIEGVELPDPKICNGTVQRVRWTPFVASPENAVAVTAATVVLKLPSGSPRGAEEEIS
jgi:hypothetical protein